MSLDQPFALHLFPLQLTGPADRFGFLTRPPLRRFLVELATLHFPEGPFALHLLFQRAQGLFNIVVTDDDSNDGSSPQFSRGGAFGCDRADIALKSIPDGSYTGSL